MPGELGEVVPKTDSISLPAIELCEAPSFVNRSIWFAGYDQADKEGARWLRRNRVGHSLIVSCSHNWWSIIPCDPSPKGWPAYMEPRQPYRDHPEYYALVSGRRRMSHYGDRMGGQVCTTNPDVIRIFAETAVAYFRKHPDEPMFSISWNDGGVFCECERCRALDSGTDAKGRPIVADRLATFYNAVGRLVYEKCPDKLLSALRVLRRRPAQANRRLPQHLLIEPLQRNRDAVFQRGLSPQGLRPDPRLGQTVPQHVVLQRLSRLRVLELSLFQHAALGRTVSFAEGRGQ